MMHYDPYRTYHVSPRARRRQVVTALLVLLPALLSATKVVAQAVSVTPDGATTTVAASSTQTYTFNVQNTGGTSTMYNFSVLCPSPLSSCTASPLQSVINGGASLSVVVTYRSGAGGTTGTLSLIATKAAFTTPTDTGTVSVSTPSAPSSGYLSVDTTINNYSSHRPGQCEGGCFTAAYALSTAPYVSGDAPRSVSLAYNGDAVATRPIVSVDAALGGGAPTLQEYWLEARDSTGVAITFVNGDTKLRFAPPSAQTNKVRLSGQFDASAYSTGVYPITVVVTAKYAASRDSSVIPTRFLVVNARKDYAFNSTYTNPGAIARGWYVAAFSKVYKLGGDALVLDGTGAATFTSVAARTVTSRRPATSRVSRRPR